MKGDIEVAPETDGDGYIVQYQGLGVQVGRYDNQEDAIDHGRQLADEKDVEFFIKGEDGQIRDKDSHGNDPPEIPG